MNTAAANSTVLHGIEWNFSVSVIFIISNYAVDVFLALPMNIYIIVILLHPRRGAVDPSEVFSLNQAFSEMFYIVLGIFHSMCSISVELCFFKPLGFFLGTSMALRCLFPCCVCLERYLAVVHPVTFLRYKPVRYRVVCSIVPWMFSLVTGIACTFTYPKMSYSVFAVMHLLVLIVDVFCCASILKRLRQPRPRDTESNAGEMNSAKKKAFQVVCINLLIFLIQNIPISVAFGVEQTVTKYAISMPVMTALVIDTLIGLFQPIYVLYRSGKLSSIQSVCFPTHSSTC